MAINKLANISCQAQCCIINKALCNFGIDLVCIVYRESPHLATIGRTGGDKCIGSPLAVLEVVGSTPGQVQPKTYTIDTFCYLALRSKLPVSWEKYSNPHFFHFGLFLFLFYFYFCHSNSISVISRR